MKDWMKTLPDDLKITGINIPGTHDSACCFVDFSLISKTQHLTVSGQLDAGVRFFDFRFKFDGKRFIANHSIAYCRKKQGFRNEVLTADDVVHDCIEFVRNNPSETILFQLKEAESHMGTSFFDAFYEKYILNNSEVWYTRNGVPTLAEVRGRIVLLRVVPVDNAVFSDENCGIDFTAYPYIGSSEIHDWRRGAVASVETGEPYTYMFVQDSYKVGGKDKIRTVNDFLGSELSDDEFNICCLNSVGWFLVPRIAAKVLNSHIAEYPFESDKTYGIIAMDFADKSICDKIIRTNYKKVAKVLRK